MLNYPVILSHQRNTTAFLKPYPPYWGNCTYRTSWNFTHKPNPSQGASSSLGNDEILGRICHRLASHQGKYIVIFHFQPALSSSVYTSCLHWYLPCNLPANVKLQQGWREALPRPGKQSSCGGTAARQSEWCLDEWERAALWGKSAKPEKWKCKCKSK